MVTCPKCNALNEDGATRCRSCGAILPVKIGSKSQERWERVRRKPDLVGVKCPKCGTINPYTRFRCKSCNALLSGPAESGSKLDKVWVVVGIGAAILATVLAVALRAM